MTTSRPTLTIAVPTYNRAAYLSLQLEQLGRERSGLEEPQQVELLVSDNCSPDETRSVVEAASSGGLQLRYLRNTANIGSDRNIAQCFNEARGRYVLIMGDDDLLVDGVLVQLIRLLQDTTPGVVLLRPFGYDQDFRAECPGSEGEWITYRDAGSFLLRAGAHITLISACVIRKELLEPLNATQFVGGNLVQVHLVLRAIMKSEVNVSFEGFAVACKRNNSGGYVFSQVFVQELSSILEQYRADGLTNDLIHRYESRLLTAFYPYYIWRQTRAPSSDLALSEEHFDSRFGGRWEYRLLIRPMFTLPRPMALIWGTAAMALGRILGGDLRRGMHLVRFRIKHRVRASLK